MGRMNMNYSQGTFIASYKKENPNSFQIFNFRIIFFHKKENPTVSKFSNFRIFLQSFLKNTALYIYLVKTKSLFVGICLKGY